jgi:hypothetical protein
VTLAPDLAERATPPPSIGGARLTRRRNPLLATVCALVTVGCALAAYLLTTHAAGRVEVVQITAAVPAGAALTRIAPAEVAADSHLDYVLWSQRGQLTRYRTAAALVPGQLLFAAELTTRPAAPTGDLTLGIVVKAGAYPLGLAAGAHVAIILLPATATGSSPASGTGAAGGGVSLIRDATVAEVTAAAGTDPTAASAAVSLYLPEAQAADVAQAAAAGQIALALTGSGS